ncbi:hypothetical protein LguiA_013428 [Lonicera macranthoides]
MSPSAHRTLSISFTVSLLGLGPVMTHLDSLFHSFTAYRQHITSLVYLAPYVRRPTRTILLIGEAAIQDTIWWWVNGGKEGGHRQWMNGTVGKCEVAGGLLTMGKREVAG